MKTIALIVAPFHGGVRGQEVGAGPLRLLDLGLVERLETHGFPITTHDISAPSIDEGEIGRAFEVKRLISQAVADAFQAGSFPLVLAGNCNAEVGTFAGLGSPDIEIVWFDGHTDFYTPETLDSGYFDSMGAATLTGQCWRHLAQDIPGFRPLESKRLIYCGSRNLDAELESRIKAANIRLIKGGAKRSAPFSVELATMLQGPKLPRLVHLDLDCLDTSEGLANRYAEPGGLLKEDLTDCLDVVGRFSEIKGLTVASYDPEQPGGERIGEIAIIAIEKIAWSL